MSAALQGPAGRIPLETTPLMIGYTSDNRLVVNDAQITAITAIIAPGGQNYTITAVSSAYAVMLNEQQLVIHVAHELHPNDTIRIGETTFTYEESQPAAASSTPIYPMYAEANPYGYDINNEPAIKAAPEVTGDVQTGSMQPVVPAAPAAAEVTRDVQTDSMQPVAPAAPAAPNLESPVYQGPVTPIPNSGVQWQQYPITGNNLYAAPSATSTAQPFIQTGTQPVVGTMPPGTEAKAPVAQKQQNRSNLFKLLLIALAIVIVLIAGGSGALIYQLTRPQPIITLSSQYMQNNVAIGTVDTKLHVQGYKFSSNAPITILLDNQPIMTGASNVHSDGSGNFQADLPITTAWSVGTHKLTAKDSGGYLATNIGSVRIVNQGEDGTPGPNGAPPDNGSFTLRLTLKQDNSSTTTTRILTVTEQSSSNSTTVCDELSDNGQQLTNKGSIQGGVTYTRTDQYSCKGSYKGGKLNYTEMLTSEKINFSGGVTCQAAPSVVNLQLEGSFSDATTLSGTYSQPSFAISCSMGQLHTSSNTTAMTGTWTGTIA